MSTFRKDVEYSEEAEPIGTEVQLTQDENDIDDEDESDVIEEKYPGELENTKEERYPGELENTNEAEDEEDHKQPAIFGGPTNVKFARRKLLSLEDNDFDDEWVENEQLPFVDNDAVENLEEHEEDPLIQEDYDRLKKDDLIRHDFDGMTEEEFELNKIRLQRFLDDTVVEDEWVDVEEEEDTLLVDNGDKQEDDPKEHDPKINGQMDSGESKYNDSTSSHVEMDTEENLSTKATTNEPLNANSKVDFKTTKSKVTRPGTAARPGGPAEPSGPAKSGPSYKPKAGELDHFVQAPTEPIQVMRDEIDLNGIDRVAADGIASQEECDVLINLVKREARQGGGYDYRPYAHTKYELFEGVTIEEASKAAEKGRVSLFYPLTMMHIAERSRQFVEEYFDLAEKGLWFSYTHLVCRTAEPDSTRSRQDLSHPIHADNCHIDAKGVCHKEPPAFTWRDWSAITYLNDDFEGGEFIFAHANGTVQAQVNPQCGRIVAFSAGEENFHGVKGVISGSRCALALWFTLKPEYRELKFYSAANNVTKMYHSVYGEEEKPKEESKPKPSESPKERPQKPRSKAPHLDHIVKAPAEPVEIVMDSKDLNGTNRVAADGIASREECETLVRLVQAESTIGDGYDDDKTTQASHAHTIYELFEGLTIENAIQAMREERVSMFYPLAYVQVAERSRKFVEQYFKLTEKSLYISFTHLVCRTAEPDSTKDRQDLSHAIHGDNCDMDGLRCVKRPPAFTWRDWSAITYLNDDFEGGEFIFAHANKTVQAKVKPQSGRIVAFSAGAENLHGVKAVVGGSRCALALWFTHDYRYREEHFYVAVQHFPEMYESLYGGGKRDEL